MQRSYSTVTRTSSLAGIILQTNSVIRNTYILLSLTLLFSAFTAWLSMMNNAQSMGFLTFFLYLGLLSLTSALRNSVWGLVSVFALTGFLGYTLGPILNMVVYGFSNGTQLVMTALGLTGLVFLGLSGYALTTRKEFSYMNGFLFALGIVLMVASIAAIFLNMPALSLFISAGFVLFSSGVILFETSQIINGGERNYIMATVSLYVALYNLFISLLQLLMVFAGRRD